MDGKRKIFSLFLCPFFLFIFCCSSGNPVEFKGTIDSVGATWDGNAKIEDIQVTLKEYNNKYFYIPINKAAQLGFQSAIDGYSHMPMGKNATALLTMYSRPFEGQKVIMVCTALGDKKFIVNSMKHER